MHRDLVGGLTTFYTMAYIVVVNPSILSDGTGIPFSGALTATVLLTVSNAAVDIAYKYLDPRVELE